MKIMKLAATMLFIFTILLSVPVAMSQDFGDLTADDVIEIVFTFIFGPDIPSSWLTWRSFMQLIVFPFIALFAVSYGIMSEIRIFRSTAGRKVGLVVSAMMALIAGKVVLSTIRGILVVNVWLATVGFGLVLIMGLVVWIFLQVVSGVSSI